MDIHARTLGYGWTPKESCIDSRHRKVRLLFSKSRKISSGPSNNRQLNRHWPLCPGIKRPGREADHSTSSREEVRIRKRAPKPSLPHTPSQRADDLRPYYHHCTHTSYRSMRNSTKGNATAA